MIFFEGHLLLDTLETTFRAFLILLYTVEKEMLVRFFSRRQLTTEKVSGVLKRRKRIAYLQYLILAPLYRSQKDVMWMAH